jgi:hypothetical protein
VDYFIKSIKTKEIIHMERVWSHAAFILLKERMNMNPILFEAIMFLKYNKYYWGRELVYEAMAYAQNDLKAMRLDALMKKAGTFDGEDSDDE